MFKPILLLSIVASLSACESINQTKQCDAEKNYIISNPEAIQEYQKLKSQNKVRSYYHNYKNQSKCDRTDCLSFNPDNYDFVEMNFNDDEKNGVYTINAYKDLSRKDCILKNTKHFSKRDNYCFVITKNINNEIKSIYEWNLVEENMVVNLEFNNLKTKENLFKYSYQTYSTGAIGGPGGGICPHSYTNHPEFKFNPYAFP